MSMQLCLGLVLLIPLLQAGAAAALARRPLARDICSVVGAFATAWIAIDIFVALTHGYGQSPGRGAERMLIVAHPLPGVSFALRADPFGSAFALLIAGLGALNAVYGIGYARASGEPSPSRLQGFSALTMAAAFGAAFAANLFTLFVFYQALTLAAFPLLGEQSDAKARQASRLFLAILLSASIALLLPAIVWTYALTQRLDFAPGGVFTERVGAVQAGVLLSLFVLGLAQAGLAPLHRWVIATAEAPAPAAALFQAVGVASVGGFAMVRITLFIFGPQLGEAAWTGRVLAAIALLGALIVAIRALRAPLMRTRLAYSTVVQMSLVAAGALLGAPTAAFAAMLQLVAHGVAKFALILGVGAVEIVTGRSAARDFAGLGRKMPWVFASLACAALSLAGAPPLAGAWPNLWLTAGAAETGAPWAAVAALALSLLNFASLAPAAMRGLFAPAPAQAFARPDGASVFLVFPAVIAGGATLVLIFLVDPLSRFLNGALAP